MALSNENVIQIYRVYKRIAGDLMGLLLDIILNSDLLISKAGINPTPEVPEKNAICQVYDYDYETFKSLSNIEKKNMLFFIGEKEGADRIFGLKVINNEVED